MKVLSFAAQNESFAARCTPPAGQVSLSASAETGQVGSIAAAAVRGFNAGSSKLAWIKATKIFFVAGDPVSAGDYLQVTEVEASNLVNRAMATLASDAEVAAAQADAAAKVADAALKASKGSK